MQAHYDAIILSPHLDDAALSCGGQIARRAAAGQRVLVVTITAGDVPDGPLPPFAAAHHTSWQLEQNAVAARRAEDVAACIILGAEPLHWALPDCIYRRGPAGEPLHNNDDELFGGLHPLEQPLVELLAAQIAALPPAHALLTPLALGGHADHWLTRLAAERSGHAQLLYYEDYPYVQRHGRDDFAAGGGWRPLLYPLNPAAVTAKLAAIAAYRSQIVHLFGSAAQMEADVHAQIAATGGECVWQRVSGVLAEKNGDSVEPR